MSQTVVIRYCNTNRYIDQSFVPRTYRRNPRANETREASDVRGVGSQEDHGKQMLVPTRGTLKYELFIRERNGSLKVTEETPE